MISGTDLNAEQLVQRLDALVTLGVRVPVRAAGLRKLATMGEIGERILRKAIAVLEGTDEKKRYWPLSELLMVERAVAEQCFPAAASTVPVHMRSAPEWLQKSEIAIPPAWGSCVWCDEPSTTERRQCPAPDGDGHLFQRQ